MPSSCFLKLFSISITFNFFEPNRHFILKLGSDVRDDFNGRRCIPNIEIPLWQVLCLVCRHEG